MTYYVYRADGPEWEDSEGRTVLAEDGTWVADLDEDGALMEEPHYIIAAHAARALGLRDDDVDVEPAGYTVGQVSPINAYTRADAWRLEV